MHLTTACGVYCKRKCTKHSSLISATLNNKHCIRIWTEWAKLYHTIIAAAVHQWRCHLSACVRDGDGHFEHCLTTANATFTSFNSNIVFLRLLRPLKPLFTSRIEKLIFRSDLFAVVSYEVVHFNAWWSFIFTSSDAVYVQPTFVVFGFALPWRHFMQKLQLYIYKVIQLKQYWFHFFWTWCIHIIVLYTCMCV